MKKCPFCGADIEDSARFCLYCMQSLTEKEQILLRKKKKPQWLLIIAAIVAVVGASILLAIMLSGNPATPENDLPSESKLPDPPPSSEPTQPESEPTQAPTQPATEPHTHSYTVKTVTDSYLKTEADCTHPATYYYSCSCGEKGSALFQWGEAKGHTEVADAAIAATCTVPGKTEGTHCSVCQLILVPQQHIPESGHSFDPDDPLSPCTVCGAQQPHAHDYCLKNTAIEYQKEAATCLAPAVYYYSCVCGEAGSETFSSEKKGEHVIVTDLGYPATCDTAGLSDRKYCSYCQYVFQPHSEIRELGHTFESGDSLPTCLVCGDEGTILVQAPDSLFFCDNTLRIDGITYVIRRDKTEEKWEITVSIDCTNLSSSPVLVSPDCNLYFYDANGQWTGYSGLNHAVYVQPNKSGTCIVEFFVPNSSDVYKLVIS